MTEISFSLRKFLANGRLRQDSLAIANAMAWCTQMGPGRARMAPHVGTWMGPKCCKTKHMANLDGTPSDLGWELEGPGSDPVEGLDGTLRDSNRRLGFSEFFGFSGQVGLSMLLGLYIANQRTLHAQ